MRRVVALFVLVPLVVGCGHAVDDSSGKSDGPEPVCHEEMELGVLTHPECEHEPSCELWVPRTGAQSIKVYLGVPGRQVYVRGTGGVETLREKIETGPDGVAEVPVKIRKPSGKLKARTVCPQEWGLTLKIIPE